MDLDALIDALEATDWRNVAICGLPCRPGDMTLNLDDLFALRMIGRDEVLIGAAVLGSFMSYLDGTTSARGSPAGAVRHPTSSRWGLSVVEVTKICLSPGLNLLAGNAAMRPRDSGCFVNRASDITGCRSGDRILAIAHRLYWWPISRGLGKAAVIGSATAGSVATGWAADARSDPDRHSRSRVPAAAITCSCWISRISASIPRWRGHLRHRDVFGLREPGAGGLALMPRRWSRFGDRQRRPAARSCAVRCSTIIPFASSLILVYARRYMASSATRCAPLQDR